MTITTILVTATRAVADPFTKLIQSTVPPLRLATTAHQESEEEQVSWNQ